VESDLKEIKGDAAIGMQGGTGHQASDEHIRVQINKLIKEKSKELKLANIIQ
jgi:hypothetical protein